MKSKRKQVASNNGVDKVKAFMGLPIVINSVMSLLVLIFILSFLSRVIFENLHRYEVGDVVTQDIVLVKDVVDLEATEALRREKASQVEDVLYIDFSILSNARRELNRFFSRLRGIKEMYGHEPNVMRRVYAGIESENKYGLTETELMALSMLSYGKLEMIESAASDYINQKMTKGVGPDEMNNAENHVSQYVENLSGMDEQDILLLEKIILGTLVQNQFVNQEKTDEKKADAFHSVDDILLSSGTVLVKEGEKLSEKDYQILVEADMMIQSSGIYYFKIVLLFLWVLASWAVAHLLVWVYEREAIFDVRLYGILMSLFIVTLISSKFFYAMSPYFLPVVAFGILGGIMLKPIVVMVFGVLLVMILHYWLGMQALVSFAYILSLIIVASFTRRVKQRTQIVAASFISALLLSLFCVAEAYLFTSAYDSTLNHFIFALSNGILSSVLAVGILPFYEVFFGVLTPFKLLELSNPNKPLLKRLLLEAPGTYHHSVLVGNLAETAAHDIGANSLLTRVAAFYHDVGKLHRPFYFKENQVGLENPHNQLPPLVSAHIIKEHMIKGIELCQKNKLPQAIIDLIQSHHGTTVIKYFYYEEKKNNPDVEIEKFVYPGPKPQSKEAVILMFADSVEAAVRTLESPTKEALADLIDKIVAQKVSENQLVESDITMIEIESVKRSFINVLSGIFHERIVYPDIDTSQLMKEKLNT